MCEKGATIAAKVTDSRESIPFNDIIIDICPPGDTEHLVLSNIAFFENNPCDIAFTATRTSGQGCRALEEYTLNKDVRLMYVWKDYNNLEKQRQTDGG